MRIYPSLSTPILNDLCYDEKPGSDMDHRFSATRFGRAGRRPNVGRLLPTAWIAIWVTLGIGCGRSGFERLEGGSASQSCVGSDCEPDADSSDGAGGDPSNGQNPDDDPAPSLEPECTTNSQCEGTCIDNGCSPLAALGESCDDDSDCQADFSACPQQECEFRPGIEIVVQDDPASLTIGDLNADGRDDMVVATVAEPGIRVFLADGDGGFRDAYRRPALQPPAHLVIGDFNGDDNTDVVALQSDGALFGYPGTGGDELESSFSFDTVPGFTNFAAASRADVDGDGVDELVAAIDGESVITYTFDPTSTTLLSVLSFEQTLLGASEAPYAFSVQADGSALFAYADAGDVVFFRSSDTGTFVFENLASGPDLESAAVLGRIDDDPEVDFAAVATGPAGGRSIQYVGGLANPAVAIADVEQATVDLQLVDVDDDGRNELVVVESSQARVFFARGDALSFEPELVFSIPSDAIGIGDFNGDGRVDFAFLERGGGVLRVALQ
ncbi:MAG: VCBS repeat-containing protein [Myxococcota bacterium]